MVQERRRDRAAWEKKENEEESRDWQVKWKVSKMAQVCQGLYPKTSYSMGKKAAQNLTDEETEDQDQDREGYKDEWVSWKLDRERMTNVRCSSGK